MRLLVLFLLAVIVPNARADLSQKQARKLIARMPGFELTNSALRIKSISASGALAAEVTAEIRTVFKFEKDKQGNAANCAITTLKSTNNIVFEEDGTTIALLGVHDLIVVRTQDALLICHRHEAERIKDLIVKIPPELQ